jgi:hypothetical protein
MPTKALKRKATYLCILGPLHGTWATIDDGLASGYKQFNRAHSFKEPRKLSAILIHNESVQIQAGLKW